MELLLKLPPGFARCTACGQQIQLKPASTGRHPRPRGLSFLIQGCAVCGHIMAELPDRFRDLTRAEADQVLHSPLWDQIRIRVEEEIGDLRG